MLGDYDFLKHKQRITSYDGGLYRHRPFIMVDTETVQGRPYTIQFYRGEEEPELFYVNEESITKVFLSYLVKHFKPGLVVWAYYLPFDMPIICSSFKNVFTAGEITLKLGPLHLQCVTGKTWFMDGALRGEELMIRDAFQFLFRGLDKAAEDLQVALQKFPRPPYLGSREPKESERADFERYAKRDVVTLWHIVEWIRQIHMQYNLDISISLADLCGKIFRAWYFDTTKASIWLPSSEILHQAILSYHGGKTECYVETPCKIRDVIDYDITSAYPYAMIHIPNFMDYGIFRHRAKSIHDVEPDGIYQIRGALECPYRGLYDHDFVPRKLFDGCWVTGYELQAVSRMGEFEGVVQDGWRIESNREAHNAVSAYVWDFFRQKAQAKSEKNVTKELWAKLALNSLYGKFIARIPHTYEEKTVWRGGALFNPLMATCVTGFLRAYIHGIEHAVKAYHTSTDSFLTRCHDAEHMFPGVEGLGALRKVRAGDAVILRRKLYMLLEPGTNKLLKMARHGFWGEEELLYTMYMKRKRHYWNRRMVRLKEAMISKDPDKIAFSMRDEIRTLNIDWSKYQEW